MKQVTAEMIEAGAAGKANFRLRDVTGFAGTMALALCAAALRAQAAKEDQ